MARPQHTPPLASLKEAITVLFCLVDDAYAAIYPTANAYGAIERLSDSEVICAA